MKGASITAVIVVGLLGCRPGPRQRPQQHVYVSGPVAQPIDNINLFHGRTFPIPDPAGGSAIVGLAYHESTDRLFVRVSPGTRILEVDITGHVIRDFQASGVNAGCAGQEGTEFRVTCGLAIRQRDRHLFLDDPTTSQVVEIDDQGNNVGSIPLRGGQAVGGLGYHQRTGHLYVLYMPTSEVAVVDGSGNELRSFQPNQSMQPMGLDVDTNADRIFVPLVNGTSVGSFDLQGKLLATYALQGPAGPAGGVAAGAR